MAVYKVIKTQLGCVELGMHCGKIVWCGFGCASWAQNCRVVCPSGGSWAQKDTQTCPEVERVVPEYSLDDLLRGRGSIFRWEDLQLQGTPLQLRVWQELFNLLPDKLITYSELAARCGYPKAVRAVATAVGKNPVSLIIPCHRVVRKGCLGNARGERWDMGNYRWGKELKIKILEWEGII